MAAGDVVRLSVKGVAIGQQHIHTLHFRFRTSGATEADLIGDWRAANRSALRGVFLARDYPVQVLVAQQVAGALPLRAPSEVAEDAGNSTGTNSLNDDAYPPWVAQIVSLRTAYSGKSRRGRFFLGGMSEGMANGGTLSGTQISLVAAYANGLITQYGPAGANPDYELVVWSKKLFEAVGGSVAGAATPVTGVIIRAAAGTMKSRAAGSGA